MAAGRIIQPGWPRVGDPWARWCASSLSHRNATWIRRFLDHPPPPRQNCSCLCRSCRRTSQTGNNNHWNGGTCYQGHIDKGQVRNGTQNLCLGYNGWRGSHQVPVGKWWRQSSGTKGKVPVAHEDIWGSGSTAPLILSVSAGLRWVIKSRSLYPKKKKKPGIHWVGGPGLA